MYDTVKGSDWLGDQDVRIQAVVHGFRQALTYVRIYCMCVRRMFVYINEECMYACMYVCMYVYMPVSRQ